MILGLRAHLKGEGVDGEPPDGHLDEGGGYCWLGVMSGIRKALAGA